MLNMANNKKEKQWDNNALNGVVLWSLLVLMVVVSGYSLYRQHRLELRVEALEQQQLEMQKVMPKEQKEVIPKETKKPDEVQRRDKRDVVDCVCPAGKLIYLSSIYKTFFNLKIISILHIRQKTKAPRTV